MSLQIKTIALLSLLVPFLLRAMDDGKKENGHTPVQLALLVSGTGSNMEAILSYIEKQSIEQLVEPRVVISNRKEARALKKAQREEEVPFSKKVPTSYLPSFKADKPGEYSQRLIECLETYNVTPQNGLVCLAGFMKILDKQFVTHFKDRIINVHPSLLPAFPGTHAIQQAFESGVKVTGCTVHFVDEGMDTGAIIEQQEVRITDSDTLDSLETKIHKAEHAIYPMVVELFARGKLNKDGKRVTTVS